MSAGDPRFFARTAPQSLVAVAAACGADAAAHPADRSFVGVAPLQTAGPEHVSFFDNRRYAAALAETRAGAVIVAPAMASRVPATSIALVTKDAYLGWARVAALFHPEPPAVPGVHPAAVVDLTATVDPSAEIGPGAVIGAGAEIGPRCRIAPLAVIGEGVKLGADCRVGPHASISHALIGARVRIYPGARVGQEGFGFAITATGPVSVPQLGRVLIEDDVEVGANATIDRGSAQDTVIGAGSRLDNLVQIGHNVRLGRCCVIVAQVGISGSAVLEDFVMLGGQSGVTGHIRVGRGARVSAQAGVMNDVPPGAEMAGTPAMPARDVFRQIVALKRLGEASRGGKTKEAVAEATVAGEGRTGSG